MAATLAPDGSAPSQGPAGPAGPRPASPQPAAAPPAVLPPLQGRARALGTLALSLATFMNVLDTSIANVSIPAIAGDLGVSPTQGTWVITSFAVANAIAVPLTGWLTRRIGPVRLFTGSVLAFVLASWLCGLAPSIEALIAFRVLQGLVAGPMIPLSQTLLLSSYPPALAGTAMAMWAMTTLVAPVMGPLLGGWITDNIAWPWIFYINVPVGLLAAGITWSIYRRRDPGPRRVPLDVVGLGLLVLWVGALQVMIDKGKELDWFASQQIVVLAVVAAVGFLFFLAWELTEANPIVELRLFARRNFLLGTASLSLAYGLFFGNVVLLPLWLQQSLGYTATWAGIAMAPVGLLAIVLSPWVGRNVGRIDPRRLATVAFLGFGFVLWLRSGFTPDVTLQHVLVPTVLQGAAMAFFFIPLQSIVFSGLGPAQLPAASGLSNFVRITAGAIGTSVFTTAWESRTALHHAHLTEGLDAANGAAVATLAQLQASGLTEPQARATLARLVDQQASTMAVTDLFHVSALLFVALIAVVWLARPARGSAGAAGGGGAH
ncbi:DHA2 family efflux MFS transporter permease subunit [Piscinibacter sakaiensis]|uniref:Inner membrane component of tripartite multidrug resistance system n=1 Tax=Piscinibacter sakaiensis TaxID=1547922 RepID=A0A0K8NWC5_PISS1|nr:DHA2 family efflux MFS transporter permease subunit [Piscinibacter sakaiensis]GAP34671.1 inner membrane component of tripartite multidrug resistance system [Piscinibacter sakaiensis]